MAANSASEHLTSSRDRLGAVEALASTAGTALASTARSNLEQLEALVHREEERVEWAGALEANMP